MNTLKSKIYVYALKKTQLIWVFFRERDKVTVIEIAIFFNKLQYVFKPKATHRERIKLASDIWNCECTLI